MAEPASVSQREYFERWFALERARLESDFSGFKSEISRIWDRFASLQIAVDKFENSNNERMRSANEFRDTLKDQAARLATTNELAAVEKSLEARIDASVTARMSQYDGMVKSQSAEHQMLEKRLSALEAQSIVAESRHADQKDALAKRIMVLGVTLAALQMALAIVVFMLSRLH